jgi:cephalosporin-C deacetylase-like acetyl esterase
MNKQHLFWQWANTSFLFFLTPFFLFAQLEVTTTNSDGIYKIGETASFQVQATYTGTASYEIIYANEVSAIKKGSIDLVGGQPSTISYTHNEADLVICRVDLNGVKKEAAAVFSPLEIDPLEEEPNDFDSFWESQKNLKNSLPLDYKQKYHSENGYQTTYSFSIANIDSRRIYGYISIPKGDGPFPACITLPPYGSAKGVTGPDVESAEKGGMIAVSLSIHNSEVDQDDPNAYSPDDNSDRNKFYYRYALIGAMHVIDYLETRDDFDGNVCAMGVSQGGGLSTILAGIDNRVSVLIASNPILGQHIGYKYNKASGFPFYLSNSAAINQTGSPKHAATIQATKYYDAMFHARRFKGSSLILLGMEDLIVPGATSLAIYNQLKGRKVVMISRDDGHNHTNDYWGGRYDLIRRNFEGTLNPPFPYGSKNKGYLVDAGADQTVGTTANLQGKLFNDNTELNNLKVFWKKVSGPGTVNFSNENAYSTSANFSQNGNYTIQFVGRDESKLANENKVFYLSDEVNINVTGGTNPTITLDLNCPNNQNIQLENGQNQIAINWDDPNISSNCPIGTTISQVAGPQKGSLQGEGNYTISYQVFDGCNNTKSCDFNISISKAAVTPSNIIMNCPNDITLTAPAGASEMTVNWEKLSVSTTCNEGGTTGGNSCNTTSIDGYSYMGTFNNSQFYLSNSGANWADAKAKAIAVGGQLAHIRDKEMNDFIQKNINGDIVFIGINDAETEGQLVWTDGSSLSYSNFPSGFNNSGDNDFGVLYPWNGEWDLNNKFVVKKYIVEIACQGTSNGSDNGLSYFQTAGIENGEKFPIGTTQITYTATDNCNNTKTCSFNVTINETSTNLNLSCPSNQTINIPKGSNSIGIDWEDPTGDTNCPNGFNLVQTSGPSKNSFVQAGTYSITYKATDNCGNEKNCSFKITVVDTPTQINFNCIDDQTITLIAGETEGTINWPDLNASSDCPDGANLTQTSGPTKGSLVGTGTYTITYEATDNCGNKASCSFQVLINTSSSNLTLNCNEDKVIFIPSGENSVIIDWETPTAQSNCPSGVNLKQTGGLPKNSLVGIGFFLIIYEATDGCGNKETCEFYIEIKNQTGFLNFNCINDQSLEIGVGQESIPLTWSTPIVSSTCGGNIELKQISGVEENKLVTAGTYPIVLQAKDGCDNIKECNFTVTVTKQSSGLNIICPQNGVQELLPGETQTILNWPDLVVNTNCSGNPTITQVAGNPKFSTVGAGTYVIAYEVSDDCGEKVDCSFEIEIKAAPVVGNTIELNCPEKIYKVIPASQNTIKVDWNEPNGTTACPNNASGNCKKSNLEGYSYVGEYGNSHYYKSNKSLNFEAAEIEAEKFGGFLAKIESEDENEFLRKNIGQDLCLIGLNDAETEGVFKWIDGTVANYTKFKSNLNNSDSQDFALMNFWNGEWELVNALVYKKYLIEVPCTNNANPLTITHIDGPTSGSELGVGSFNVTYEAKDACGNSKTCSFEINITKEDNGNGNGNGNQPRPDVSIFVDNINVSSEFSIDFYFNKPVSGLDGHDIALTNANWKNFKKHSAIHYSIIIDPIEDGIITIALPENIAFDNQGLGNTASTVVRVIYSKPNKDQIPAPSTNNNNCVIKPISATLLEGRTLNGSINNLINGSGLSKENDLNAEHGGGILYDGVWLNEGTRATIKFDLGEVRPIDGIALWNYSYHHLLVLKRRGVQRFRITVSEDDFSYSFPFEFVAHQTTESGLKELAQTFHFPEISGRYVIVELLEAIDDFFYIGLGEIRLLSRCTPNLRSENSFQKRIDSNQQFIINKQDIKPTINIFPNPTSNVFTIELPSAQDVFVGVEIINGLGATINRWVLDENGPKSFQMNLNDQADGVFFVKLRTKNGEIIRKKIIKTSR